MLSFLLLAGVAAAALAPQNPSTCGSPEGRAFDFWIGDWTIEQKIARQDGTWLALPARTSVAPALGGCALIERWHGDVQFFWEGMNAPEAMEALSVRAFDPQSGKWLIHWMDTRSRRFGAPFSGGFTNGRGEFVSERPTPQGTQLSRITFSNIRRDAVRWELAISSDNGGRWSTIWIMEMRRAGRPPSRTPEAH
jgi:hypothetical protein